MSVKNQSSKENNLLEGLIRGEEIFYRRLFDLHYNELVIFANRMLNDQDLARSIVQDVFVMFYEKRNEINIHTSLKALLYQSVRNRCLNYIKREKMTREHHKHLFLSGAGMTEPSQILEFKELEKIINNTIEALPNQCRRIFKMSRHEGQSNQEIARELSISKRTVETQISKALKRLRESLLKNNMLPPLIFLLTLIIK